MMATSLAHCHSSDRFGGDSEIRRLPRLYSVERPERGGRTRRAGLTDVPHPIIRNVQECDCVSESGYEASVVPGNSDLVDTLGVEPHPFLHTDFYLSGRYVLGAGLHSDAAALQMEMLALRHQLNVLQRSVKRPKLTAGDRYLWARLSRLWSGWRSALVIVKPETMIGWHRQGFRLFWTWKVRRGQAGRPPVCQETRKLIRQMSRDNPLGSAAHPWRTPQTRHRHRRNQRWQIYGARPQAAVADLADLPRESLQNHGIGRLFHGADRRFQVLYVFLVLAHDRGVVSLIYDHCRCDRSFYNWA